MTVPVLAPAGVSRIDLLRGSPQAGPVLAAIGYGVAAPRPAGALVLDVPAPVLAPTAPATDTVSLPAAGSEGLATGRTGAVRWAHDGHWLFGVLDAQPVAPAASLEPSSHDGYREVFATLRETGYPHLLRLWNYLPDINREVDGLERYRQFNIGRQRAFLDAHASAFEGSPAACALGTHDGHLRIAFLAARQPCLAVENPRQVSAYRYPAAYGPRSPTFSRAALVDAGAGRVALLVSGTASIVGHATVHPGDVAAQVRETGLNLQALVDASARHTDAAFRLSELHLTVYVRHAADAGTVHAALQDTLGANTPAMRTLVMLQADICRSDLLVEIEAHAVAPGGWHP